MPTSKPQISYADFAKIDIRVGQVVKVEAFPDAVKPAYKLWINFGADLGIKTSSAQLVQHQTPQDLLGNQVICVVNFPPKHIGPFTSEVLTLGARSGLTGSGNWLILTPFKKTVPGAPVA